jgi:hypothetical protein
MLHTCVKDLMWRKILKYFTKYFGTKLGLNVFLTIALEENIWKINYIADFSHRVVVQLSHRVAADRSSKQGLCRLGTRRKITHFSSRNWGTTFCFLIGSASAWRPDKRPRLDVCALYSVSLSTWGRPAPSKRQEGKGVQRLWFERTRPWHRMDALPTSRKTMQ